MKKIALLFAILILALVGYGQQVVNGSLQVKGNLTGNKDIYFTKFPAVDTAILITKSGGKVDTVSVATLKGMMGIVDTTVTIYDTTVLLQVDTIYSIQINVDTIYSIVVRTDTIHSYVITSDTIYSIVIHADTIYIGGDTITGDLADSIFANYGSNLVMQDGWRRNDTINIDTSWARPGHNHPLDDLENVLTTGKTNRSILYWNQSAGMWQDTSWQSATGTVISVALSLPSDFTISGSPVTTSGTLTAVWASKSANLVFASPNGSAGTPLFRKGQPEDIGIINGNIIIGNGSSVGQSRVMSGDVTISATGVTTIQPNAVRGTDISLTGEVNGDVMYFNGTDWVRLGVGTSNKVLKSNGTLPYWGNDSTGAGLTAANGVDNRLATFSSATALNGEANLTFDGTTVQLTGKQAISNSSSGYGIYVQQIGNNYAMYSTTAQAMPTVWIESTYPSGGASGNALQATSASGMAIDAQTAATTYPAVKGWATGASGIGVESKGYFRLTEQPGAQTNYVQIGVPAMSSDVTLTLPGTYPSVSGQSFSVTTGGVMSYFTPGTVTSIAMTTPSEITTIGSPITGSGTFALSWTSQAERLVFRSPISGSGTPAFGKVTSEYIQQSDGYIMVGNSSNAATERLVSGDATMSNTGALAISDNAVDGTDIALTSQVNGDIMKFNGTDWVVAKDTGYLKTTTDYMWGNYTNSGWIKSKSGIYAVGSKLGMTTAGETGYVELYVDPAHTGFQIYTMPPAYPASSGYQLTSQTDGTLSWAASSPTSGTVTSVATSWGLTGGTITSTGTLKADSSQVATQYDISGFLSQDSGYLKTTGDTGYGNYSFTDTVSVREVESRYGNLWIHHLPKPEAPTASLNATPGNLSGEFYYRVSFLTAQGESELSDNSNLSDVVANEQITVEFIPTGEQGVVIGRNIYRVEVGNYPDFLLITTINDNTTTTYNDNNITGTLPIPSFGTATGGIYVGSDTTLAMVIDEKGGLNMIKDTNVLRMSQAPFSHEDYPNTGFSNHIIMEKQLSELGENGIYMGDRGARFYSIQTNGDDARMDIMYSSINGYPLDPAQTDTVIRIVENTLQLPELQTLSSIRYLTQDPSTKTIGYATPTLGSTTLAGLTDVNVTGVTDDDVLYYDAATAKWRDTTSISDTSAANTIWRQVGDVAYPRSATKISLGTTRSGARISLNGNATSDTLFKISNSKTGNDSTLYMYSNGEVLINGTENQTGVLGLLRVTENGGGVAIQGESNASGGVGLAGYATTGNGVIGSATSGYGFYSTATTGTGLFSTSSSGWSADLQGKLKVQGITKADTCKYDLTWNEATGEVKARRYPAHCFAYYSNNTGYNLTFSVIDTYYPLALALTSLDAQGFTVDNDTAKLTYTGLTGHVKFDIDMSVSVFDALQTLEVQVYNVTDAAEVPTSQLSIQNGGQYNPIHVTAYDINATTGDVYLIRARQKSGTDGALFYRLSAYAQTIHY